jgi:hypothetical protein
MGGKYTRSKEVLFAKGCDMITCNRSATGISLPWPWRSTAGRVGKASEKPTRFLEGLLKWK